MKATLKLIAAAAMIVGAGAASAAISNNSTGDGSLLFVALDTHAQPISYTVDLGYTFSAWDPALSNSFYTAGTSVVWNFNNNTLSVNGAAQTGTYNWSSNLAAFNAVANTAGSNTTWGVISGDSLNNYRYLTTGNPTAAQIAGQSAAVTANMALVDNFYTAVSNKGSMGGAGHGSMTTTPGAVTDDSGYVGSTGNFGVAGNWQGNLNWNALAAAGSSQGLYLADGSFDGATKLAGTFSYANGVLTYSVAAVPEGDGLALAMAGLGLLGFVARRRQAR